MQMTQGEIKREYDSAADKRKQIQILAELNICSKQSIRQILIQEGIPEKDIPEVRNRAKNTETESAAVITEAVKKALEEKTEQILSELSDISKKILTLKQREELLTSEYAEISAFIGKVK